MTCAWARRPAWCRLEGRTAPSDGSGASGDEQMATIMDQSLDTATIDSFKTSLRGALLRPGDDGYDAARQVWNGMIDKRPALIARCAGTADVIQAVNFARTNNLLLSV